jgi:microcystin-dependent protein
LYNSSGTPISRGVSAVADFTANNAIRLPLAMSRVFGQAGDGSGLTNRALGDTAGSETHTLLQSEMADHSHGTFSGDSNFVYVKPGSASITTGGGGDQLDFHSATGNMSSGGGATPFNIIQPSLFINAYIKL